MYAVILGQRAAFSTRRSGSTLPGNSISADFVRRSAKRDPRRKVMADLNQDEQARHHVLLTSPVIAIVGRSNDHYYSSYQVGEYLIKHGFTVYNVNPNVDEIDGEKSYETLKDVPEPIDIVDVFRKGDFLPEIVDEAIAVGAKTVWGQLEIVSDEAREKALAAGLNYAENICLRTEHERMFAHPLKG
jgi:predicted CoA-binding protein